LFENVRAPSSSGEVLPRWLRNVRRQEYAAPFPYGVVDSFLFSVSDNFVVLFSEIDQASSFIF